MSQIADVDGFDIMNNLRLVIIVAIFIVLIIVLLLNRIIGSRRGVKQKDVQEVNLSDDSSRKERDAPGVVGDFFGMNEEKSKGGESAAESGAEIEGMPVVNYEKVEADLKAIRDEVTTKIEGLILKVEAVETEVLNKIENVIDVKVQEASNKINDRITEVLRTQRNSTTSVSEKRVDSLRKEEVPADILPSEDTIMPEEIKEKEQTDTIAPSGEIEKNISAGDVGESVDFDIEKLLEEEPVGMSSVEEPKEEVEFEEKKERDLEVPSEVKKDVKVDEKESIETVTSAGETEEKISGGDVGGSVDFDIEKFLEEEPVGMPFTEETREVVEGKPTETVTSSGETEEKITGGDVGGSVDFDIEKFLEEEPVGISFTEESREVVEEKVEEGKPTETVTSSGETEEKVLEKEKGKETEEKKQSTEETVDFDIQAFLEELGTPPSEKDLKSEKG